jgi:uncharacterized protein YbjQ (UPF0145 family)
MNRMLLRGLVAMALPLALIGSARAAETSSDNPNSNDGAMCTQMMQQSPEGRKAMEDFMKSDRAPQAMTNMMEMARRMGNGDAMVGMTRMMEMMGSMGGGGMMGGQGGMMQPGGAQPGK